jgi:hypothetical protein
MSSLQAAPTGYEVAGLQKKRLPSLADEKSRQTKDDAGLAVWTVRYEQGKVWPARAQLPGSREVVSTLRDGRPVALYARGAQPTSKEFRERVRALSRYLSKVADMENVPISTLPADHLDADTIEIFATR